MAHFLMHLDDLGFPSEKLNSIPSGESVRDLGCHWLDLVNPSAKDLKALSEAYGLHPASVKDCLDPEHLPKIERLDNVTFIILRAFDEESRPECDEVHELTRKVAIFSGDNFVITIHRRELKLISELRLGQSIHSSPGASVKTRLLYELIHAAFLSYSKPIDVSLADLEQLEVRAFRDHSSRIVEDGYFLKRRAFVFKRMVRLSSDLLPKMTLDFEATASHLVQDLKEEGERLFFYCEELLENMNSLLNLHLSLESHLSGEVMRLLTVLSVIFLPLNFMASIFGMNFEHMPELKLRWAYPAVLALMFCTATGILLWMRRRGWLRRPSR